MRKILNINNKWQAAIDAGHALILEVKPSRRLALLSIEPDTECNIIFALTY